uniref:Uncharacterized protein n=1 Tax=Caenorhabditis japonica TaxID=281687 RepID=A0A8R1HW79_CAEJA
MPRLVKKSRSSIRRGLNERDSTWSQQVSTKLMRSLESMSARSSSLSSVTDVAHIHSNKTMLPLTPATPQRTGSRLKESKCSIGRLAARASMRLRTCGKCSFLVFIKIDNNTTIFKTSKLLCNVNGMLSASTNLRNSLPLGRKEWSK